MRNYFYLISFFILILSVYLKPVENEFAVNMQSLWLLAFAVISADFTFRLKNTIYVFFPLFFTIHAVMTIIEMSKPDWFLYLDFIVHAALGTILIFFSKQNYKVNPYKFYVLLISGILLIIISLNVWSGKLDLLNFMFRFNIWYYLLAAITGRLITLPQMTYDNSVEKSVATYLFILSLIVVIRDLIRNFLI